MSEHFNQGRGFQAALDRSNRRSERLKQRFDLRSQLLRREMTVFDANRMIPAYVVVDELAALRARQGAALYQEAWRVGSAAYTGGVENTTQLRTMALANTEVTDRAKGRLSPEQQRYFVLMCLLVLLAIMAGSLTACTDIPARANFETDTPEPSLTADSADADATVTATVEPTNAPTLTPTDVPATPTPELAATEETAAPTLQPTDETPLPTVEDGSSPIDGWEAPVINDRGDYSFACQIESISYDVVEILPGIDATGFIICNGQKIPAGIYDRNANTLFYWDMMPIKNPEVVDYLGERAIGRLVTQFGFGRTYLDGNKLIGANVIASVGLPSVRNRDLVNAINIGRYTGKYYPEQSIIDVWATTGKLPKDKPCLYPYSLAFTN